MRAAIVEREDTIFVVVGAWLQIGIPAGINSEYLAGMRRNLQSSRGFAR